MRDKNSIYKLLSAGLLALFGGFRMTVMGQTGLGDSESYYFSWSRHIDLSYYDHPPVTAWLIRFFTDLGSIDPFYVRLPSLLLYLGSGLLF